MIHISELGEYVGRFLHWADRDGHVPEHSDHWSDMNFDHGSNDPDEPGISAQERQLRTAYLDEQWWPSIIGQVNQEKTKLSELPDGSPIKKWAELASKEPPTAHGFGLDFEN